MTSECISNISYPKILWLLSNHFMCICTTASC